MTLHEGVLERGPPVPQRGAQPVPAVVHLLQPDLQLLGALRVRLDKLGAAQVDGQDYSFALVHGLLELLLTASEEGRTGD